MKALALPLLALALGGGVLYLLLDPGGSRRGERPGAARASPASGERPAGRTAVQPEPGTLDARETDDFQVRRQAVETAPAAPLRAAYEGAVIAEGAPVQGASVELLRRETLLGEALTDQRGRFRLDADPPGSGAVLRVRARGFVAVERKLPPRQQGGTEMLGNLRLLRGQRVTGRVLDERSNGVVDADLLVEPINAGGDLLCARGRSTSDGSFEIPDAPPGMVRVTARARGLGEQSAEHDPRTKSPLEIRLQPGVDLHVALVTPRGAPVVGAEVAIQAPGDPRGAPRVAESDEQGQVVFEGLGARLWNVRVTHPDYKPTGKNQVQPTGGVERIECRPWPAIEGTVSIPGGGPPPAGTRVQALPASAPGDRIAQLGGGTPVEENGHFRVSGLRPGDWTIRVAAPGYAPAASRPVKLGPEGDGYAGTIELSPGGRLALRLSAQEKPLAGAEVELFASAPSAAQLWALQSSRGAGLGQRARSGADGLAVLGNLSEGQVWVAVFAEGCPPASSGPHRVDSTGAAPPVEVELQRGARIHGRVLGKDGAPQAAAQLRITERAGKLGFPLTLASDEAGRYTSVWLPPGHYAIEAFASSDPTRRSGTQELDLAAGEQRELDLSL